MKTIEGATNPEIKANTRYEYCTFEGVMLDYNTYNNITFVCCDFISCGFDHVKWVGCSWDTCFMHKMQVVWGIFKRCKMEWLFCYSSVENSIAEASQVAIINDNSKLAFTPHSLFITD